MLLSEDDEPRIFDNGLDLWFECLADPPDLVIVDLMLTSLGGLDFLTLLRSHKHWEREPVVLEKAIRAYLPGRLFSAAKH